MTSRQSQNLRTGSEWQEEISNAVRLKIPRRKYLLSFYPIKTKPSSGFCSELSLSRGSPKNSRSGIKTSINSAFMLFPEFPKTNRHLPDRRNSFFSPCYFVINQIDAPPSMPCKNHFLNLSRTGGASVYCFRLPLREGMHTTTDSSTPFSKCWLKKMNSSTHTTGKQ